MLFFNKQLEKEDLENSRYHDYTVILDKQVSRLKE